MPKLTIHNGEEVTVVETAVSTNLRQAILDAGLTPYAWVARQVNCGGRGLCATCGVWVENEPAPTHWHDKLAKQFRYPRLSCQVVVTKDMVVHLIPEKRIWGNRRPR